MPPVPAEQLAPYPGAEAPAPRGSKTFHHRIASNAWAQPPPHLTTVELSNRWRITVYTLSKMYRGLGLRPIKIGRRLLFPLDQIEAVERHSMEA